MGVLFGDCNDRHSKTTINFRSRPSNTYKEIICIILTIKSIRLMNFLNLFVVGFWFFVVLWFLVLFFFVVVFFWFCFCFFGWGVSCVCWSRWWFVCVFFCNWERRRKRSERMMKKEEEGGGGERKEGGSWIQHKTFR